MVEWVGRNSLFYLKAEGEEEDIIINTNSTLNEHTNTYKIWTRIYENIKENKRNFNKICNIWVEGNWTHLYNDETKNGNK